MAEYALHICDLKGKMMHSENENMIFQKLTDMKKCLLFLSNHKFSNLKKQVTFIRHSLDLRIMELQ